MCSEGQSNLQSKVDEVWQRVEADHHETVSSFRSLSETLQPYLHGIREELDRPRSDQSSVDAVSITSASCTWPVYCQPSLPAAPEGSLWQAARLLQADSCQPQEWQALQMQSEGHFSGTGAASVSIQPPSTPK